MQISLKWSIVIIVCITLLSIGLLSVMFPACNYAHGTVPFLYDFLSLSNSVDYGSCKLFLGNSLALIVAMAICFRYAAVWIYKAIHRILFPPL